ncbi:hypothetical protein AGR8A_Cc30417 [Agrobacterium fabrum str. J-07]|nr:hypothetical protein AGR8A_Cc30417 [Agrobacterium fabrum str. J-07]
MTDQDGANLGLVPHPLLSVSRLSPGER